MSKLVTENVTGASIACLQEQDLSDLKIAKPVFATWCPVRHFLLILFQKPFCNCLSAMRNQQKPGNPDSALGGDDAVVNVFGLGFLRL